MVEMKKKNIVTLKDIAAECGLSRAAVAQILSGNSPYKFKDETIRRVKETAAAMNYRPDQFAASLRKKENKIILCIVGEACRHSDVLHLRYLEHEFGKRGYNLVVQFLVGLPAAQQVEFIRNMAYFPAGIVIWSLELKEEKDKKDFAEIFVNAPPTISMTKPIDGTRIDFIRIEWSDAPEVLFELLKSKGVQAVGACFSKEEIERGGYRNFCALARKNGITGTILHPEQSGLDYYETGRKLAEKLLRSENIPDALYCVSDEISIKLIELFQISGKKLPLIITGGDSEFCKKLEIPLPVLIHDMEKLVNTTTDYLLKRIESGEREVGSAKCVTTIEQNIYLDGKKFVPDNLERRRK